MPTPPPRNITLVRGLGLLAATAILVGGEIGTGDFFKARVMACSARLRHGDAGEGI